MVSRSIKHAIQLIREEEGRRDSGRFLLKEDFPGKLTFADSKTLIDIQPVDVSKRGLGALSSFNLEIGQRVMLEIKGQKIRMEVIYCTSYLGIENIFKCGFFMREADIDLKDLFTHLGLIILDQNDSPQRLR